MSYKSLLTVLTHELDLKTTLPGAIELARRFDAHLELLCLGIDRTQTGYYYAGAAIVLQQDMIERAREGATAIESAAERALRGSDIRWSSESAVTQFGALVDLVAVRARFCDLVILPKPFGEFRGQEGEAIVEAALFEGRAPVLVLPENGLGERFAECIVVAWNQSVEALVATRKALPLLTGAREVDIAVIDPPTHGPERSDPGGALSQMLARHGAHPEVTVLSKSMPKVSDVIRRHVADKNADLLVMGAYGHSRFREAILGGATRAMLEETDVPVLMAH